MDHFTLFEVSKLPRLLKLRPNETKFGERVKFLTDLRNIYDQMLNLDVKYVVFGIKESIGVAANLGNTGTERAWEATLKVLLNVQSNEFTKAENVLILGEFNFEDYAAKLNKWDGNLDKQRRKSREMVTKIDEEVTYLVSLIIKSGKIPIAIGGGHNNSYGMIKGASLNKLKYVNCVNFDAHSDFRSEEGRHSGNGFSYAFAEGFLNNYFIFGLHENYTSDNILRSLKKLRRIDYVTFEDICISQKRDFNSSLNRAYEHVSTTDFGIEIDCDAIKGVTSSAMTPTGFEVEDARRFVHYFGNKDNVLYLHICEASPTSKNENQIGKIISSLILDFIKANAN